MKRILCPKCDNYITFDETKYSEGQSLVFICENCKKLDYVPGNYTDRVMTLANQITLSLEKAFPNQGKAARFFAYQGYVNLPVKTKAVGNLQVEVTRGAPYLVTNWAKYVKNLQRWDYNGWFSFKWGVLPTFMLQEKIRLAKELTRLKEECKGGK